jgi:hypothetical protein
MFDRLVCMSGGNPRPDLIDKKSTLKAQALEKSPQWQELTRNHLEGRTAAFFCYGSLGADELDSDRRPKILRQKQWFVPGEEPYHGGEVRHIRGSSGSVTSAASKCRTIFGNMPRLASTALMPTIRPTT